MTAILYRCKSGAGIHLGMSGLLEGGSEPLKSFVQTITGSGSCGLDVPGALAETVKAELVSNLGGVHGIRQILFVGENQKKSIPQFVLVEHALQFLASFNYTITIVAIDYEDNSLGVLEIMSPERTNLVLTTNIPNRELNVLVLDSLDVEANSWDRCDNFTKLQLV